MKLIFEGKPKEIVELVLLFQTQTELSEQKQDFMSEVSTATIAGQLKTPRVFPKPTDYQTTLPIARGAP